VSLLLMIEPKRRDDGKKINELESKGLNQKA
jgi:hypothetical protein